MAIQNYLTNSREYHSWSAMKQRCNNPKDKRFANYGGRGITYCKEWDNFENFIKDMGKRPDSYSLDRIDNNGNYCKENCRWSNIKTQMNNTSRNTIFFINNIGKTLSQWISNFGLKSSTVRQRFYVYGWSLEKSLNYELKKEV